jgi:hypothetical protein
MESYFPAFTALVGTVVGGLITASVTFWNSRLAHRNAQKQFLFQNSKAFSELLAAGHLPRSGDVPPECQKRLEECRRLRQVAIETYLFLPAEILREYVKTYGDAAVKATTAESLHGLPQADRAFLNTLKKTRSWLTGQPEEPDFPFVLPCVDWNVEERRCASR